MSLGSRWEDSLSPPAVDGGTNPGGLGIEGSFLEAGIATRHCSPRAPVSRRALAILKSSTQIEILSAEI